MNKEPEILVGIMADENIEFEFGKGYKLNGVNMHSNQIYKVSLHDDEICLYSKTNEVLRNKEFTFASSQNSSSFLLKNVTIGIGFHWEQKEDQQFSGGLKLIIEGGKIRAINIVPLEAYLRSVISSEMSATCSPDLLKAHAVISRSWLLAQIEKTRRLAEKSEEYQSTIQTEDELIRWYDREDHANFDVCADDHCQRYQGITKIINKKALEAIDATAGQVLMAYEQICDARFSKCCGGISESFDLVWEPVHHSYLTPVVDSEKESDFETDLRYEASAEKWIRNSPRAFCNTNNQEILAQILPGFDQATSDFYRWEVTYNQNEIADLITKRTGIDFGQIIKLEPIERGFSGRLIKLKIIGSKRSMTIGKELEIRRSLSTSHLYSSAFVVDHLDIEDGIPQKFILTGAGWGHGVGLCQIGAAVMGESGYSYDSILKHYFKGAELNKIY